MAAISKPNSLTPRTVIRKCLLSDVLLPRGNVVEHGVPFSLEFHRYAIKPLSLLTTPRSQWHTRWAKHETNFV